MVAKKVTLPLLQCLGRPICQDVVAAQSLPGFSRSSVDGFAIRAEDCFGASEQNPIFLDLLGAVAMGQAAEVEYEKGGLVEVPTGGALPAGANAVVMVENTQPLGDTTIEVRRSVAPGENVIGEADDVAQGDVVLSAGEAMTASHIGLLAALGLSELEVYEPLDIAVLATGDEVVPFTETSVGPGCVRNVNSPMMCAMMAASGFAAKDYGIVRDDPGELERAMRKALAECQVLLVSGGSSAGARDFTCQVIEKLEKGRIDFHGLRLAPGKPTILGRALGKPVIGLPGHPVSCAVVVDRVVRPLLRLLAGEQKWLRGPNRMVTMAENVSAKPGREEYVRVHLEERDGEWLAYPVRGPSGAVATLAKADGVILIPLEIEGVKAGDRVAFFDLAR